MRKKLIYLSLLGCVSLTTLCHTHATAQVTHKHIAELKAISSSAVSADGTYIAYTLSTPVDPTKDNAANKSALYVLNTKTGISKAYYTNSNVGQVKFRPKKGSITFLSKQTNDKTNAIFEINLDGGEAIKLFTHNNNIASYAWNSDGQQIAFTSVEKNTKPKTSLTYSPTFFEEEFGDRVGYIVNLQEASSTAKKINANGSVYMAEWSPNSKQLAISVAPTSSVDDSYMAQSIKIVDASTLNIVAKIDNKGKLGQIVWSPDSKRIAIVAAFDLHDPTNGSILIANATGGTPKVIDANYLGKYESIDWSSPNTIHFLSSEGTASTIGTIQPNDGIKKYIFKSNTHSISSYALAANGQISFIASTPEHPSELFTLNSSKKEAPIRRTQSNDWLKGLKLGKQESISYKARDGKYEIQGLLIYPLDYTAGKTYPLITVVHGGPESHYSNGWLTGYSMPGQMGAANGYAVFYPNYRGSTGRGIDFTYSSQGDLAGKEFDDIVDGVDHLIEKGIADKKRIGITGGSYGGYASAWMSTYYSGRFAASVMFVGISNNISKFGTSDIPSEMYLVHSKKRIWDDWQWQLERSPIYHVDKAKTPILIMHGAEDPRVHPAQSMELYRHLKVRKPEVPVRLIYYPGEGHGNARSGSKYDYNLRMMQWFDTYLKTGDAEATLPSLDLPE